MSNGLFTPLDEKNAYQYRAVGVVRGRYYPSATDFTKGILATSDSVIEAIIALNKNSLTLITPDVIDDELLFHVYPRTNKEQNNSLMLQLNRYSKDNLDVDNYFSIRGSLVAVNEDTILVRIQRNTNRDKAFYLGIKGTLPQDGIKKFWDLECIREGIILKIVKSQVIEKVSEYSDELSDDGFQPKPQVAQPTFIIQKKVTLVRSEITLKFNEIPPGEPAPDKKVRVTVSDENDHKFVTLLNAKSYRKACETAATYSNYAGNISGKLGKLTLDGFEVLEAGIKVFEVKAKGEVQGEVV
ncbi:MAG: hypothetical protein PUP92_19170 [Rhizonema sp. PD38]|nr:hypothetical protein [Rhizonema sp. PD38]